MSKSNYKGNFTKEELAELELDRLEALKELQERKDKAKKVRSRRTNRHLDWSEGVED